ncbi:MAG: general secretion pathway protein GspB [Halioglobus sp.]
MSLILDALNRSHEETDEVPTLGTRHDYAGSHEGNRLLPVIVLALLAALLMIGWLLWDRQQEAPVGATTELPAAEMTRPQVGVEPISVSERALPSVSDAIVAPVTAAAGVIDKPAPEVNARSEPDTHYQEQSPVATNADVSALYAKESPGGSNATPKAGDSPVAAPKAVNIEEPVSPKASSAPAVKSVAEQSMDIEQMLKSAEDELQNARLEEHSAPFVNGLSQQTKDAIPSIFYERHDYSGRPGQSRVVLNGKDLKVGGSPASGVKVEEILPDSVVLDYRGTQFRLRALNSWVNL